MARWTVTQIDQGAADTMQVPTMWVRVRNGERLYARWALRSSSRLIPILSRARRLF